MIEQSSVGLASLAQLENVSHSKANEFMSASVDSLKCWLSDSYAHLAALLSFVSADSLRNWLCDRCSSLAALSS